MTNKEFSDVFNKQVERCDRILNIKSTEYTGTNKDRLIAFKQGAALQGLSPGQVLGGYLAKHIASIYTMLQGPSRFNIDMWDEKITDAINYLILLRAIITEDLPKIPKEGASEQDRN